MLKYMLTLFYGKIVRSFLGEKYQCTCMDYLQYLSDGHCGFICAPLGHEKKETLF